MFRSNLWEHSRKPRRKVNLGKNAFKHLKSIFHPSTKACLSQTRDCELAIKEKIS